LGTESGIGEGLLGFQAINLRPAIRPILEDINRSAVVPDLAVIGIRCSYKKQVAIHSDCCTKVLVVLEAVMPTAGEQLGCFVPDISFALEKVHSAWLIPGHPELIWRANSQNIIP
jgi:hypothetical protein